MGGSKPHLMLPMVHSTKPKPCAHFPQAFLFAYLPFPNSLLNPHLILNNFHILGTPLKNTMFLAKTCINRITSISLEEANLHIFSQGMNIFSRHHLFLRIFKGSKSMIECKVVAIAAKLMFSSFTKAITQCNKPNSSNKN